MPLGAHETKASTKAKQRKIFAIFFSAPYKSTNRDSINRPPAKRLCRRREQKRAIETWTHDVFCLGMIEESVAPARGRKVKLQGAGLGRARIKFDANGDANAFKAKIEEVFPNLISGHGFDLLRRGPSGNSLAVIRQPSCGYTVKYLRDTVGLGQALLYVRPLQVDLDETEIDAVDSDLEDEGFQKAPIVQCINCNQEIPVTLLKDHQEECFVCIIAID
ncbi:uncharacterized protein LOC114541478 [Dendronephthya gigantea]|uniref:uncharacterized protein LOC114541478 n=1 Tax=Dendronephthya gigantea TaxID=151771 RepID=UPI00106A87A3|nr:uncharacterized protein LOC114541478 [Dendronephthya gigantea]